MNILKYPTKLCVYYFRLRHRIYEEQVAVLKSNYWSKLNIEKEMSLAVTTLLCNFEELLNKKQAQD